jgi:two-component system, response regulator
MKPEEFEILLVEDDPADAELTTRSLRRESLANKITVARDGAEALDYIFCRGPFENRSFRELPSLILLDLKLPRLNGHDVLRTIKSDERTRSIPVIVLSSSSQECDLTRCYQLGVNSYIQKPVDLQKFQETVRIFGLYWLVVNLRPPSSAFASHGSGEVR